jgi:chemotaxis methyl-accepting protein methylase
MAVNEWAWPLLPASLKRTRLMVAYGTLLHSLVELRAFRLQAHGTFFLRNRPELELLVRISKARTQGASLRMAVIGCSNGAEVYSILWAIRSARPGLNVIVQAVDISSEILEIARQGRYSVERSGLVDSQMFERLTDGEINAMFDREDDHLRIKSWLQEGIDWRAADAGDPEIVTRLGVQDIVIANRFLCHMESQDAERCLRNIATLVAHGGYLFASGVDLDVRSRVARDLQWTPVRELLEEIHDGDPSLRAGWPWQYWGLEPFDARRPDWSLRYASVFQIGHSDLNASVSVGHEELVPPNKTVEGVTVLP